MKKKIMVGLFACTLSTQVFAFGRDSDVQALVSAYNLELQKLQKAEAGKEKQKQAAINKAQSSVTTLQRTIAEYNRDVNRYQRRYIAPTKKKIAAQKAEATNLRQKLSEYEKGLETAIKEKKFSTAWYSSEKGADDYQELIDDAKESIVEAEKKQKQYESYLQSKEQQKAEYEKTIKGKEAALVEAEKGFGEAEGGLKSFREASKEHLGNSVSPSLNIAVGQMIQNGKNASIEAELMLRDLDSLATKLGVSKADLKNVFASNPELREKMGNTALGGYVNTQISSAMGSICEYQTMCAAKEAGKEIPAVNANIVKESMKHLNDKQRGAKVTEALGETQGRDVAGDSVQK